MKTRSEGGHHGLSFPIIDAGPDVLRGEEHGGSALISANVQGDLGIELGESGQKFAL